MVHDRKKTVTTHLNMCIAIRLWRLRICTREISDKIAGNMNGIRTEDFSVLPSDTIICGLSRWKGVVTYQVICPPWGGFMFKTKTTFVAADKLKILGYIILYENT